MVGSLGPEGFYTTGLGFCIQQNEGAMPICQYEVVSVMTQSYLYHCYIVLEVVGNHLTVVPRGQTRDVREVDYLDVALGA